MRRDPGPGPVGQRLPRRATDRVEDAVAWVLTAAALVLVVAAVLTGIAVRAQQVETSSASRQARAVLLRNAPVVTVEDSGVRLPVMAPARWTDPRGVQHTGEILVKDTATAGTEVDVWIDTDGRVRPAPIGPGYATVAGIVTAAVLLLVGGGVLFAAWRGVRLLTAAWNARRWGQEWERVGPEWSGHLG